jgi:hypothetical protein
VRLEELGKLKKKCPYTEPNKRPSSFLYSYFHFCFSLFPFIRPLCLQLALYSFYIFYFIFLYIVPSCFYLYFFRPVSTSPFFLVISFVLFSLIPSPYFSTFSYLHLYSSFPFLQFFLHILPSSLPSSICFPLIAFSFHYFLALHRPRTSVRGLSLGPKNIFGPVRRFSSVGHSSIKRSTWEIINIIRHLYYKGFQNQNSVTHLQCFTVIVNLTRYTWATRYFYRDHCRPMAPSSWVLGNSCADAQSLWLSEHFQPFFILCSGLLWLCS